jgi:peptidoglycan/xylan/chitin deacetylase (PgdA/CDA1 family)
MKSKRRRRIVSRKRIRNRHKKNALNIFVWIGLGIIAFSFCFIINLNKITSPSGSSRLTEKLIPSKSLGHILLTPPPSTPTPTLAPTPTPFPLIGYCLNVPVLMYHHIQPNSEAQNKGQKSLSVDNGQFDLQMSYLAGKGYSFLSADQLVNALISHAGLPSKSVVVTMDDGYNDIYTYAYPILQKYHIIANAAIISGLVGGADYLSWGQIEEMSHSGLVNMVNHTWSHYAVAYGSIDKVRYEIATAKQQLHDHTGQNIDTFVYPFGAISSGAIAALQQEGVRGAFSEIPGHWQCDSFIMALHRTRIGNAQMSYYGL